MTPNNFGQPYWPIYLAFLQHHPRAGLDPELQVQLRFWPGDLWAPAEEIRHWDPTEPYPIWRNSATSICPHHWHFCGRNGGICWTWPRGRGSLNTSSRARENFRGCLPQSSLKNFGQIPFVLAIWGHSEWFSPCQNGPEVGCPVRLFKVIWCPTSEPFWPGENRSNQSKITKAVRIWPKFFSDDWGSNPENFR